MTRFSETGARDHWWWIFDPRFSLPARTSLIFGGGSVLFTVLATWIGGTVYRRQLEEQLGSTFEMLAVQVIDKIDRVIGERQRELRLVGGMAPFREGGNPAEQRRFLNGLKDISPDYVWIGFVDSKGTVLAGTEGQHEGLQVAERTWFREGREQPFVSEPGSMEPAPVVTGPFLGTGPARVMELAVPVASSSLELAGVIAAELRWDWATDVQRSVIPDSARSQLLGVTIYGSNSDVLLDSGGSGWTAPPAAPAVPASGRLRGAMIENAEGGTTYLTGYVRSRGTGDYAGLGWLTTVRQPVDRAFAPAREFQRIIARWAFGFALLFCMLSWAFGSKLARRIGAITAAAKRIRSGDILAMIPRGRGDTEMDGMSSAVADLVEHLREASRSSPAQAPAPPAQAHSDHERPTGSDPRRVTW